MMGFSESTMHSSQYGNIAVLPRTYVLHRNGLLKTCAYDEAIALLRTGKWYDITQYNLNEEVLTYERHSESNSTEPEASSEREESRHEQRECITEHGDRKKLNPKTNGSRAQHSQVKKRGRPKAVK